MNEDIALAVIEKLAENISYNGFNYRTGMVVAHGSLAGLPEFCEIVHTIVLQETLIFIVNRLDAWYLGHYQAIFFFFK